MQAKAKPEAQLGDSEARAVSLGGSVVAPPKIPHSSYSTYSIYSIYSTYSIYSFYIIYSIYPPKKTSWEHHHILKALP